MVVSPAPPPPPPRGAELLKGALGLGGGWGAAPCGSRVLHSHGPHLPAGHECTRLTRKPGLKAHRSDDSPQTAPGVSEREILPVPLCVSYRVTFSPPPPPPTCDLGPIECPRVLSSPPSGQK